MGDLIRQRAVEEANKRADRVVQMLYEWADWCRRYEPRLGFAPKSAVFLTGGSVGETSDADYVAVDQSRNEIVDACIDALRPDQRSAVHHRYLCAVYRMRDYAESLTAAHDALLVAFVRKGVMW